MLRGTILSAVHSSTAVCPRLQLDFETVSAIRRLSPSAARRVAVSAARIANGHGTLDQSDGATSVSPAGAAGAGAAREPASPRQLTRTIQRLGLLQIDSVNVFARAHYMPLYSRLGHYRPDDLDALAGGRKPQVFEYWGHEATYLPIESWPLWQWRKDAYRARSGARSEWATENAAFIAWLRDHVAEHGPTTARAIDHDRNQRSGTWWGWSDVKRGLEHLFVTGDLTSAGRNRFERVYATPEQAIPAAIRALDVPEPAVARRALIATAASSLGVFTAADAADYFRMSKPEALAAIGALIDDGTVEPVSVDGWNDAAWMPTRQTVPRRVEGAALLSPFDPLVWFRPRAERLFGFHYRIEIYTPEPKRIFGYYTLPFLLDDQIVGRVDLKADRASGVLLVQAAWSEPGAPARTADALAAALWRAAAWQGLERVDVRSKGNLAQSLQRAVAVGEQ